MSVKTITTVREYDEQGRVVKETITEIVHTQPVVDDGYWWRPPPGWWQNPVISYGTVTATNTPPDIKREIIDAFNAATQRQRHNA